ncbi:eukaryotic translation initiation factor 3, subunit I, partial [Pavlovales sp. CCMP2436]
LKGHERALTMIKYNRDGDLLFTVAKDHVPSAWYADNGEHIGTYQGHTGAVWCVSVNEDSTMLLTGSADNTARLWDVESGVELMTFKHPSPVRAVDFALGDSKFLTGTLAVYCHSSGAERC